ncbi:MAG TPA: 4Fe-4S dicluster domain-containing protein, partial [Thermoanaerobaculia bacterium]|nr:4Fe-4S dicluster domain-containing protein [Thermoanaerobaculia bacterium]
MSDIEQKFWKGLEEREPASEPVETSDPGSDLDRRSFLLAAGFAAGGAFVSSCSRSPIEKAVPYLTAPEEIVAGKAYWMASTCGGCSAGCGTLIKCRDGRPIKLEGLPEHPLSQGGLCAVGQASVLELYDAKRFDGPLIGGKPARWNEIDPAIVRDLSAIRERGGKIRILTGTLNSPTSRRMIDRFVESLPGARHVAFDPLSASAILDAHTRTHGARLLPRYRFDRATVVASFDADFLGTWISPVEFTAGYQARRRVDPAKPSMSWHIQFEPRMSLTGTNADERVRIRSSEITPILSRLRDLVQARRSGTAAPERRIEGVKVELPRQTIKKLADRLWEARGASLVVSGSQRLDDQVLINEINTLLGNYGRTVDLDGRSYQKNGNDVAVAELLAELRAGTVDALFIAGVNPVAELPDQEALVRALARVPLLVSMASGREETSLLAHYVCPEPHFLESWSDVAPAGGVFAVIQPAIQPLRRTRTLAESLAAWMGEPRSAYDLIRATWEEEVYPRREGALVSFQSFWDQTLHDGFVSVTPAPAATVAPAAPASPVAETLSGDFELVLYPTVGILDGAHAHNPWLQELPDPVTKVTWGNYCSLSPVTARKLGIADGDVVALESGSLRAELPALVQPGQHDGVVAVALGYGRIASERFSDVGPRWLFGKRTIEQGTRLGVNAAPFLRFDGQSLRYSRGGVTLRKTGRRHQLASTQMHHSLDVPEHLAPEAGAHRPIVQVAALPAFAANPHAGAPEHHHPEGTMWAEHEYPGPHWGMAVDLSACTGCSGCVIACQAENNIPVVGRDEVLRQREMHWIRIDRYYSGDGSDVQVVHQPMLCQHCDNAPCETVCPVLATVHSSEGLNQQVYNRCVGTRYCANNCPFKVRRFNWFDYPHEDRLARMVLNPDVTVRSRGVMEKCSFCVQRIQEAKHEAKRKGEPLPDGEVRPACEQSCPAKAIVFGDVADP